MKHLFFKTLVLLLLGDLFACVGHKHSITSDPLPTMKDLYQQQYGIHTSEIASEKSAVTRDIKTGKDDWNPTIRNELQNLDQAFRYLPNPILTMYIFPHLTDAGTPVPGYTTFFKFYEADQVGLPSEFPPVKVTENTAIHTQKQGAQ